MNTLYDDAIVCGRFQPFHNDHLEYILSAMTRCRFLWIGIAKPWQNINSESHCHREGNDANPFNFIERLQMIRNSLIECGVSPSCFCIIPFDFEERGAFAQSNPPSEIVFMTKTDAWSDAKFTKLESCGKIVEILYEKLEPDITGTRIRELLASGDLSWKILVPPAVVRIIDKLNDHAPDFF